jgi:hypothetical protein
MMRARILTAGCAGLLLVLVLRAQAADKITWKPLVTAIFRIDDSAPKLWNLYHTGKKIDPLLLQLGGRYLVIYVRNEAIYELVPAVLDHKGADLLWRESDKPDKPLATSDWSTRDVGSAWRVQVKLSVEGRRLDIEIPQMPDLRGLY